MQRGILVRATDTGSSLDDSPVGLEGCIVVLKVIFAVLSSEKEDGVAGARGAGEFERADR